VVNPISEHLGVHGVEGGKAVRQPTAPSARDDLRASAFQEVLRGTLRFSKHAQDRLAARGLNLDAQDMQRLEGAVDKAAAKGSRDSLVLMDNLALVVSIRNRTVITAVDAANRRDNVFTNIDSVVLAG